MSARRTDQPCHDWRVLNETLVSRFYAEVWNAWDADAARELLHPELRFRGSLGRRTQGIAEFLGYVADVRVAFPDFHNHVEDLVTDGPSAVARLSYSGTHRGTVLGAPPTGNRVEYDGIAWFTCSAGRIVDGFVLGDIEALRAQLVAAPTK